MAIGKNADGLKGFPTPNTIAGISGYLLFLFEDKELAQWLLGALEPMQYEQNWYEAGDLSPDEAAELFRVIIQDAPYNLKACANPAGGRILRVSSSGHVEELSDANTWEEPTGDYAIPPVPEREGGTPEEQICLAAKNAANVLQLLYENVTDSFNDDLDEAEAATALTLTLVGLVGVEFAPITFALITFFGVIFGVLYGLLEFVGADLWDEDFTNSLTCILQDCATNTAGVVTFDYECFNAALAAQTTIEPLTFEQLRLFGQLQYLLLVIGGVDALNAAGATTAITDDDCSFCGEEWCITNDFVENCPDDFSIVYGACSADGITGTFVDGNSQSAIYAEISMDATYHFQHIEFTFSASFAGANRGARIQGYLGGIQQFAVLSVGAGTHISFAWDGDADIDNFDIQLNSGTDPTPCKMESMIARGTGEAPPFLWPCEEV